MAKKQVIILLNDTNQVLARVARQKFLAETDWEALITSSYDEALAAVKEDNPDIVLTEIILRDEQGSRTGFDLIKDIRSLPGGKGVQIAVLTDLTQEEDMLKAEQAGANHYFVKSETSIQDLIRKLQGLVRFRETESGKADAQ